mgnify:CR=1 FL=1
MPSIVTHHYFAKDILNKLNNETKKTFQNSYPIFLIPSFVVALTKKHRFS